MKLSRETIATFRTTLVKRLMLPWSASALVAFALTSFFLFLPAVSPTISAELPQPPGTGAQPRNSERSVIAPDQLVGNVDGTVRDAETLLPIPNAEIFLLEQAVQRGGTNNLLHTNQGDVVVPEVANAVRRGTTNTAGEFLINAVPVPFPSKPYTIVVRASGYGFFIADSVPVLPGAVMTLNVDAKLRKQSNLLFEPSDSIAPFRYRHEMEPSGSIPPMSPAAPLSNDRVAYTIFATREGLVGHTTANGHVIRDRDHFVALPSTRVLNANDQTNTFRVRLTYGGKSVDAPVWDVGPWNIYDDYWNPSGVRQMWQDLPQGMPEAQAAYQNKYNGGLDQYGRKVTVPTAIDLADGTFWDDLGMVGNGWVSVSYLWKPNVVTGDRIFATADLPVRSTPAGSQAAVEPCGGEGIITGGPVGASLNRVFYVWWQVLWDDNVQGWSAENQIGNLATAPASVWDPVSSGGPVLAPFVRPEDATTNFRYWFPIISRQRSMVACPQSDFR